MELKNLGLGFAVQRNSTKGARVMINRKGFGKSKRFYRGNQLLQEITTFSFC